MEGYIPKQLNGDFHWFTHTSIFILEYVEKSDEVTIDYEKQLAETSQSKEEAWSDRGTSNRAPPCRRPVLYSEVPPAIMAIDLVGPNNARHVG